jgi:putative endonuclease
MSEKTTKVGTLGEQLTERWLQLQNYESLARNWRSRWGEIDLIARNKVDLTVAFVEVKTRSYHNWDEYGLRAIDSIKQQKIVRTASLYLAKHPQLADLPCRFDVALVRYQKLSKLADYSLVNFQGITRLDLGQSVVCDRYKLVLANYLQSAFDLSS